MGIAETYSKVFGSSKVTVIEEWRDSDGVLHSVQVDETE